MVAIATMVATPDKKNRCLARSRGAVVARVTGGPEKPRPAEPSCALCGWLKGEPDYFQLPLGGGRGARPRRRGRSDGDVAGEAGGAQQRRRARPELIQPRRAHALPASA